MDADATKPVYTVQVRELIEFVLRKGDLGGGGLFAGSDRALAGIRGHQQVQRGRPEGYQREIPVEHRVSRDEFDLCVRGRIDGVIVNSAEVVLEEIKTVRGKWDQVADPLHWAQAKYYGFIYARDHAREHLVIQLSYLELETGRLTELRQSFSFADLSYFARETTAVYLDWILERHEWRAIRDRSIRALAFPFSDYRPGQRELAVAAYRAFARGERLFVAAPTGIGKTMSVLYPAVKAVGEGKVERIFYLTARTVGRTIAEKALSDLRRGGLRFRSVTLTAREKACVCESQACDPATCPLARGYYDRIKPALREALAGEEIGYPALAAVAQKHQVCPFELSLDASLWADGVICDYNYVFDPAGYLRRHFDGLGREYGFLVDEAHNLADRAREMFSADLDGAELREAAKATKKTAPRCSRALARLNSEMRKLAQAGAESPDPGISDPTVELNLFPGPAAAEAAAASVRASADPPESLMPWLEAALAESEAWLVRNEPAPFRDDLLGLYFRLHAFRRVAEAYDDGYASIIENSSAAKIRLFCLDPSAPLRQALTRGRAAVFFSATLTPLDYFRRVLGGTPEDPTLQLSSPFPSSNLAVFIQDRIPTHFKARAASLSDVVSAVGTLLQGRRGNYLVYFPSYQYLNAVLAEFQARYPSIQARVQQPEMTELERAAFLDAFSAEHDQTMVGFAVLGGIFGEGIDLVGERLIGAAVVGVGMPQLSVERDLIKDYFQERNGAGFDYAYTFPGMNRVLQAVGRVIRSETDRGAVVLIDSRLGEWRYRRLFPSWWSFTRVRTPDALRHAVQAFWAKE